MIQQLEAKYELYDSIEEMLAPEAMSEILNRHVSQVAYKPLDDAGGVSGSQLLRVKADTQALILKCMKPQTDWLALASNDSQCRAVRLWQYGFLDQLQPDIDHAILAASSNGEDYALLMHDVSELLYPTDVDLTPARVFALLDALATMHARYWDDERMRVQELGLSSLEDSIDWFWISSSHRYQYNSEPVENTSQAWDRLFGLLETDVCDSIQTLLDDPSVLFAKLRQYPLTLIHGDYRPANLAYFPDEDQQIALDWQLSGYAPAVLDLYWITHHPIISHPLKIAGIQRYQKRLIAQLGDRFDSSQWQPMYGLGCLAGVLRQAWAIAGTVVNSPHEEHRRRNGISLKICEDDVRKGMKWL